MFLQPIFTDTNLTERKFILFIKLLFVFIAMVRKVRYHIECWFSGLKYLLSIPFLDGDVPRSASYNIYISQLIRFARVSSHVDDFNTRNKVLTA